MKIFFNQHHFSSDFLDLKLEGEITNLREGFMYFVEKGGEVDELNEGFSGAVLNM